ncbi:MAG TPA: tetrahydrodipicolinate N-succinyltransferase N-terminal domain-containing protein [Candidatus Obscuribacterales bacterium]
MARSESSEILAFALGLRRRKGDKTLDVTFPAFCYQKAQAVGRFCQEFCDAEPGRNAFMPLSHDALKDLSLGFQDAPEGSEEHAHYQLLQNLIALGHPGSGYSRLDYGFYFLYDGDQPVETAEEAYFKLQLISHRHVQPHGVNLDGAFKVLQNLAWTNLGPILPEDLDQERLKGLVSGSPLIVSHVDKFPYLVNYHLPSGVRIAAGSQVRLGAYLGDGSTVMQAGFVNFNAGTAGKAMVEGRISAGVFVGDSTDIGGGASIMGTLSGGNKHVIAIGSECLLGANAGTGISLGDGCTIAAGLYVTAGTKVSLYGREGQPVNLAGESVNEGENLVKAIELDGRSHLLFYQDSTTGRVIAKPNPRTIELNAELHKHN